MNDNLIKKTLSPFLIVSLIFVIVHGALVYFNVFSKYDVSNWFWNYVYLIPMSVAGLCFIVIKYIKTQKVTSIGKNYIFYTMVKMLFAVVFLLPWLLYKDESSKPMVIQFFAIFFPFLLVETMLLVRLLNSPLDEKVKNEENQLQ